jgi:hypothetical protein
MLCLIRSFVSLTGGTNGCCKDCARYGYHTGGFGAAADEIEYIFEHVRESLDKVKVKAVRHLAKRRALLDAGARAASANWSMPWSARVACSLRKKPRL